MVVLCDIYFVFILFLTTSFLLKAGMTALHIAAWKGFEQIVRILVDHGSNVNLQNKVFIFIFIFSFLYLLLWSIVGLFHVDCEMVVLVWYLFCFYSFFLFFLITSFCLRGTPLHFAVSKGFEQIVEILVEHGSNVNLQDTVSIFFWFWFLFLCFISFFFILLFWFIVGCFMLLFEWLCCVILILLCCCFFNNFFLLKTGMTALHFAASRGFEEVVKILIEHGSNINIQSKVFIFIFFFLKLFEQLIC